MEIYFKDKDGKLQEVTLADLLNAAFIDAGFEMDYASWKHDDLIFVGVVQENEKPEQIVTNICFNADGNTITGLHVYSSPILRVVDEDNSKQLI